MTENNTTIPIIVILAKSVEMKEKYNQKSIVNKKLVF